MPVFYACAWGCMQEACRIWTHRARADTSIGAYFPPKFSWQLMKSILAAWIIRANVPDCGRNSMARIDLGLDEVILKQDTCMTHDRGGMFDSTVDELVLTNQTLIVVHKGVFGGVKEVCRFPLNQIKMVNGAPQAVLGRSSSGENQLHVYFVSGVEAFSLDEPDDGFDDDASSSFANLFVSEKEKTRRRRKNEKEYIESWCEAISRAVLGLPQMQSSGQSDSSKAGFVQAAAGGVAALLGVSSGASKPTNGVSHADRAVNATRKCIGCMAPISGVQGQKVVCPYCDTEQVIEGRQ